MATSESGGRQTKVPHSNRGQFESNSYESFRRMNLQHSLDEANGFLLLTSRKCLDWPVMGKGGRGLDLELGEITR